MPGRFEQSNDYWANEFDVGTISSWDFDGAEGLQRLSGPAEYRAERSSRFHARLSRVQLDHVALETFDASPHETARTPTLIDRFPTPLLSLIVVIEGAMRIDLPAASFDLAAGQCAVVDSRDVFASSTPVPVRLLRSVVGIEHLPTALRRPSATIVGALERTALIDSFIAFATTILRTTGSGQRVRGDHMIQAVSDLQAAVLAEAQDNWSGPTGSAGLRYRIEYFIENHYTDARLDVAMIAGAMQISVRKAHLVFNDGERTIARFIRDRRVSAVALELRTSEEPVQFTHLAHRLGFGSADSLARAFQTRFGMTLTDYRNGGHRNFG